MFMYASLVSLSRPWTGGRVGPGTCSGWAVGMEHGVRTNPSSTNHRAHGREACTMSGGWGSSDPDVLLLPDHTSCKSPDQACEGFAFAASSDWVVGLGLG